MAHPHTQADAHLIEAPLEQRVVLQGGFLQVRRDLVALPDGKRAEREFIVHPGAAAVIPVLDDGRVLMVRQHRYPLGKRLLEIPAGKLDAGETTLQCAQRELAEETGHVATQWAYGGEIHNAAAYSNESIWLWFARGLTPGHQRLDDGEFIDVVPCELEDLEALDRADQMPDVKTLIGLHWWRHAVLGVRPLLWATAAEHAAGPHGQAPRLAGPPALPPSA